MGAEPQFIENIISSSMLEDEPIPNFINICRHLFEKYF